MSNAERLTDMSKSRRLAGTMVIWLLLSVVGVALLYILRLLLNELMPIAIGFVVAGALIYAADLFDWKNQ